MHALLDQFFNLGVMVKAFPLLARGLGMTLLLCLTVIPLGFCGGILVAVVLFLFLGHFRTAFISLTAIPLSLR